MIPSRVRAYGAVAAVAVVLAIPVLGSSLWILRATEVAVFCVAFSGLYFLTGRLGLISVGHGAFMGLGAFGAAHAVDDLGFPYLLTPVAGAIVGAMFGAAIGVPSLRLPGTYLALLTLAMAMALPIAMRQIDGPLGYRVDGDLRPPGWTSLGDTATQSWQYLLVVVVAATIVVGTQLVTRGRFTRALIAARDQPSAAAAFGIDVSRFRLTGVVLASALAGAAGGLSLYTTPLVADGQYPFGLSVSMFALVVAIGATRLWTIVPSAIILVMLPPVLVEFGYAAWQPIVYAVVLLVMTRVSRGEGVVAIVERWLSAPPRTRPAARRSADQTAWGWAEAGTAPSQTRSNDP